MKLDPGLVGSGRLAVLADPLLAGGDARNPAVLVMEHLGGGESRVDLGAQGFGLSGQPPAEVSQADDVVAPIAHLGRGRQADGGALGQEQEAILGGRRLQGCPLVLPVGDQLVERAWFEDGAGQDVGPYLGPLFEDADADVATGLDAQLPETNRRRKAGRPGADDDHVEVHRFPLHRPHPREVSGSRRGPPYSTRMHPRERYVASGL